ncbi:MAG TPA: choice-of-anchor D domain-containing protein [Solirubrobacteraceae bacterium]|nr:choice-of-anchor D domain-containing protein [Solirubrobacteraceae bacterium]
MEARRRTRTLADSATRRLLAVLVVGVSLAALTTGASAASAAGPGPYFTGSSGMVFEREGAIAAPLLDGDLLIAGGAGQKTAVVFNPATDTFSSTPNEMAVVRAGAVAAPLPNGEVLIAGGTGEGKTAELYDPVTDAFSPVSEELKIARTDGVATRLPDGDVLITGGSTEDAAELYEPAAKTFKTTTHPMLTARTGAAAAELPSGEVLIAGGSSLASAEVFNPTTEVFSAVSGAEHTAREGAIAALLPNGQVLISGGTNTGVAQKSAELFNPGTHTFTELSALPSSARSAAVAAALPNGQVLIAGGAGSSSQTTELFFSAPQAMVAGGTFGDQTVSQPSVVSVVLVTNLGAQALSLGNVSLVGTNSGDFAITAETCSGRTLLYEQSCTISVHFTPAATGTRVASLTVPDNEAGELTIALTGTGVAANAGPTGPTGPSGTSGAQGATGATGAAGPAGPAGPRGAAGQNGQVILVTCTTSIKTVNHKPKKVTKCTSRPVPTPTTFTASVLERASLGRHGFVYASGTAEKGRVVLHARRALVAGRYTLTLVRGHGRYAVVHRTAVELP